jgi:hypothetical protein
MPEVENLTFSVNYEPVVSESTSTSVEDLLVFEGYTDLPSEWEDITLAEGSRHGLTFRVINTLEVEQIKLTCLEARIARSPGQSADLRISLIEGQDESRPRVWGDAYATHLVPYYDLLPPVDVGGITEIDWETISLPAEFVLQPNRFYCLLFDSDGSGGDGGIVRVAHLTGGTGPVNDMAYFGTDDAGATWVPALQTMEYRERDVPIRLTGEVTYITRNIVQNVKSIDVTLEIIQDGHRVSGVGRAEIRGRNNE